MQITKNIETFTGIFFSDHRGVNNSLGIAGNTQLRYSAFIWWGLILANLQFRNLAEF